MRCKRAPISLLLLSIAWTAVAEVSAAQTSVAPLQPLAPRAGEYDYDAGLFVVPYGREVAVADSRGNLYSEARLDYTVGLHGGIRFHASDRLAAALTVTANGAAQRQSMDEGVATPWTWEAGPTTALLGVRWRVSPTSRPDPVLRLEVDVARGAGVTVGADAGMIVDPLVLSGGLSLRTGTEGAGPYAAASVGMGLVANDKVTVSTSLTHSFPIRLDGVPQTTISLGVHYALANDYRRGIGMETVVATRGRDVRIGFGVSLFGAISPGR